MLYVNVIGVLLGRNLTSRLAYGCDQQMISLGTEI